MLCQIIVEQQKNICRDWPGERKKTEDNFGDIFFFEGVKDNIFYIKHVSAKNHNFFVVDLPPNHF